MRQAYFAGGCFWCITPIFKIQRGVLSVVSGFSGGDERDASYEDVKAQLTGHRETVKIEYNEAEITFGRLLEIFLANVDPYDGEGQYIDRGRSYTLAVYYNDLDEKESAERMIARVADAKIAVEPFKFFIPAGEEHQDYYLKNPEEFERELVGSGRKEKQ